MKINEIITEKVKVEDRHPNDPPQPGTKPKMPKGSIEVDVSDTQDWYQLGQDISDLDNANPAHYNQGPPHTMLVFGSEEEEEKHVQQLKRLGMNTHDIDSSDPKAVTMTKADARYKVSDRQKAASRYDMGENFADGKNPGRKGLAKRSGVNTKASVSDLRKTAKNSSGEKQRMAHWLANMKAGKAKKK